MDSETQLRLATRIHYALLRYLGTGIDVGSMLARRSYAREVLFVCTGCSDAELNTLAQQFTDARSAPAIPTLPVTAMVESPWEHDSTGFGTSRSLPAESASADDAAPQRKRWFDPARWLRRESGERPR